MYSEIPSNAPKPTAIAHHVMMYRRIDGISDVSGQRVSAKLDPSMGAAPDKCDAKALADLLGDKRYSC